MRLILTSQEYNNIAKIMESIEAGSVKAITEESKVNPLVSVLRREDFSYEVVVDPEYMSDYLNTASESATIIVPIIKSLVGISKAMLQKLDEIVVYHIDKHQSKDRRAASKHAAEAAAHVDEVLADIVRTTDFKIEKFEDLDKSLQRMLVVTYGDTVRDMVNKLLHDKLNRPFS